MLEYGTIFHFDNKETINPINHANILPVDKSLQVNEMPNAPPTLPTIHKQLDHLPPIQHMFIIAQLR